MLKSVAYSHSQTGFTKTFLIGFGLLWALTACEHPSPWAYLQEKETLARNMHIQMFKSLSAQKNALIAAHTDAAQSFVIQAQTAAQILENSRQAFAKIPEHEKTPEQNKAFQEFSTCWAQLKVLNQEVLKRAVQTTNSVSTQLELGKKDLIASTCDKNLTDLQAAIDAQNFKATR